MVNHTVIKSNNETINQKFCTVYSRMAQNYQANGLIECAAFENVPYSDTETNTTLAYNTHKEGM